MRHRHSPYGLYFAQLLALTAFILLLTASSGLLAQIGGSIGYGSSVLGTISAAGQSIHYSFNGNQGDFVHVAVQNWTGTLDPRLELLAPDGQVFAASSDSPFSEDSLAALLTFFLPQSGIYTLNVSGESSTAGDFVLLLRGHASALATPLEFGQSVDVSIPVDPLPQYFTFDSQSCPSMLTVSNLSIGLPFTFPYHLTVHNAQGVEIAQLAGGSALEDRLVFTANSGRYELVVTSTDPQVQGTIQLLVTCVDQAPPCLAALGASGLRTNACPVCFAAGDCPGFDLSVTLDGMAGFFTWTPAEGADWYIFSIIDSTGGLLEDSPRLIEGATSNTYTFNPADMPRGPFTAIVTAGAEGGGIDPICVANLTVSFDGTSTETCSGIGVGADIVPGTRAAVAHWDAVPDAAAYLLHVYAIADDGGMIGIRVLTVPGSATTYHLTDVFPSEYSRFQIRVAAYRESSGGGAFGDMPQGYLCDGGIDITFDPLGPVHWGPAT